MPDALSASSIPETFRFTFNSPNPEGSYPTVIEACAQMNFSFTTINDQSPHLPYFIQFHVQEPNKPPYNFLGGSFDATDKGTLALPFNNSQVGTQFITCMYTSNDQTGGCQNLYTVIPSAENCHVDPLPLVADSLSVSMKSPASTGSLMDLGQYSSWPTGCTDISFKVQGGTAPYFMTVANAFTPPRNYTFDSGSFEWKVDLARGYPFFLSIFESAGLSYTAGPLHVGGGGSTACLSSSETSLGVFAGPALGGVLVGLVGLLLGLWGMKRWKKKAPNPLFTDVDESELAPPPFDTVRFDRAPTRHSSGPNGRAAGARDGNRSHESPGAEGEVGEGSGSRNVFFVHHDGGGSPVTVFTDGASQVFELPPSYLSRGLASPSADASPPARQSSYPRTPTLDGAGTRINKASHLLLPLHSIEPGRSSIYHRSSSSPTAFDATDSTRSPPSPSASSRDLPPQPPTLTSSSSSSSDTQLTRGRHTFSSNGRGRTGGPRSSGGRRWSDSSATAGGY